MKTKNLSLAQSLFGWAAFSTVLAVGACSASGEPDSNAPLASNGPRLQTAAALPNGDVTTPIPSSVVSLDIGGEKMLVKSVEGGDAEGDIKGAAASYTAFRASKRRGDVKYNDFTLQLPLPLSPAVGAWIEDFASAKAPRRSGEIKACSTSSSTCESREFYDALITEITFPALDTGSKDPAYLSLKFSPEYTRYKKGSGKIDDPATVAQPTFTPSNFRISIDGLDISDAARVEALRLRQRVTTSTCGIGEARDYCKEPGKLELPALAITMPEAHSKDFSAWYNDSVINGQNGQDKKKSGSIAILSPAQKALVTLNFSGLAISRLTALPQADDEGLEAVRRVKCEMYVEEMRIRASQFWN